MGVHSFSDLKDHVGHKFECVIYGEGTELENVALECITCNEVMVDFNKNDNEYGEEGWVIWNGGPKPDLHGDTIVDVKLRMDETLGSNTILRGTVREFGWQHGEKGEWDIIAYRVTESGYSTDPLQYQDSDAWLIIGPPAPKDGMPLFWNVDENDWLEIESATIFDKPMGDMPQGGKEWLSLEQADEVVHNWKLDSSAPF